MTNTGSSRGVALTVLCAMQLMIILDGSVVAVALPTIQNGLGFDAAGLAWVVNGYLIPFAGLLLLSGRLGDLLGGPKVFLTGLVIFTVASVLCGLAPTAGLLIGGRVLQGVGGALASAVVLGMILRLYPEPAARGFAMGVYSFVGAGGSSVGLVLGGVLTQVAGWRWAFLLNVPIGVVALVIAVRTLPRALGDLEGAPAGARRPDVLGAVLATAGLSAGIYAIVGSAGSSGSGVVRPAALAVALLVGFVGRQATAAEPLLPLGVLRRRTSTVANASIVLITAAGFGFQFVTALYLQRLLGLDAVATGLAFLPAPVTIAVFSLFLTPRWAARFGARAVLLTGIPLVAAGLVMLSRAPVDGSYWAHVMPWLALMGAGMGLTLPSMVMLAMSDAGPADAGLASGLNATAQQAGGAIGTALLVPFAAARTADALATGTATPDALLTGYSAAYLLAAGALALAFATALFLPRPHPSTLSTPQREDSGTRPTGVA